MSIQHSQLKIQILAGITALLLIVPMCGDIVYGFIKGFNSTDIVSYDTYPMGVTIVPTDCDNISTINSNMGQLQASDMKRETMLFIPSQVTSPAVTLTSGIISLIAIAMAVYYIVAVIKMATVIMRQGIMNSTALKQLRKVSFSLLTAYVLFTLSAYIPLWHVSQHLVLEDYTLAYPDINENFVIAITLILLSEILNIALQLKEDQDLTI